jgi:hypothetical protein
MKIENWSGQATTGAGFATLLAAVSGLASGALQWQQAVPLVLGATAGIIWPEKRNLAAPTEKAASDLLALLAAWQQVQTQRSATSLLRPQAEAATGLGDVTTALSAANIR